MKTILFTLFTVTVLFGQGYQTTSNNTIDPNLNSISEGSPAADLPISSLSMEIYEMSSFDFEKFLLDTNSSKRNYRIDGKRYTKIELVEIFRKGAITSEDVIEFEQYLKDINPELLQSISERESVSIYYKFREDSIASTR